MASAQGLAIRLSNQALHASMPKRRSFSMTAHVSSVLGGLDWPPNFFA